MEYPGAREDSLGTLGVSRGQRGYFRYTGSIQGVENKVQVYWKYPRGRVDSLGIREYPGGREDSLGILGVSRRQREQFRYTWSIQGIERIVQVYGSIQGVVRIAQVYGEYPRSREDSLGTHGVSRGQRGQFRYTGSIQGAERIVQVYWEYRGGRADSLGILGVSRGQS